MIATISKDFAFSASHQLVGLAEGHPCGRLHGHNYVVRVEIEGTTDEVGFVLDYGDLKPFGQLLDERYDHRHLNDVLDQDGVNPTAENLALVLLLELDGLLVTRTNLTILAVGVSETPKTWATVQIDRA